MTDIRVTLLISQTAFYWNSHFRLFWRVMKLWSALQSSLVCRLSSCILATIYFCLFARNICHNFPAMLPEFIKLTQKNLKVMWSNTSIWVFHY